MPLLARPFGCFNVFFDLEARVRQKKPMKSGVTDEDSFDGPDIEQNRSGPMSMRKHYHEVAMKSLYVSFFFLPLFLITSTSLAMTGDEDDESNFLVMESEDFERWLSVNEERGFITKAFEETQENFFGGLYAGSLLGIVVWGGLFAKDYYFGIILKGGPEFDGTSPSGFFLPVACSALTMAIMAAQFKISFKKAFKVLCKKCAKKFD